MTSPYPTDLNKLQVAVWNQADQNGWHDSYERAVDQVHPHMLERRAVWIASQLALIHAEVAEATEVVRSEPGFSPDREAFGRELADIVMRTLDLAETLGIPTIRHIHQNLDRNQHRGYRHGGKLL